MKSILLRWLTDILALWLAILLVPGINIEGDFFALIILLMLFGFINLLLQPVYLLFSFPIVLITTGPLTLIFNTLVLMVYADFAKILSLSMTVNGFGSALFGALVISIIRVMASGFARMFFRSLRSWKEEGQLGKQERYKTRLEEQIACLSVPDREATNSKTICMKDRANL